MHKILLVSKQASKQASRILYLGNQSKIIDFLESEGHFIIVKEEKIDEKSILDYDIDFLISFGYRYKISKSVLDAVNSRTSFCNAINLHISYLPWNKGADPNFWSFVNNTPKGVTIHCLDENIDTGKIILQKQVEFNLNETLRSSYNKLQLEIENLFIDNWDKIRTGVIEPKLQNQSINTTIHKSIEKNKLLDKIGDNWLDLEISELLKKLKS